MSLDGLNSAMELEMEEEEEEEVGEAEEDEEEIVGEDGELSVRPNSDDEHMIESEESSSGCRWAQAN